MQKSPRHRVLAFVVAAACVGLVAVAVFTGGASAAKDGGWRLPSWCHVPGNAGGNASAPSRRADGLTALVPVVPRRYGCPQCGSRIAWGSKACPRCGWCPGRLMHDAALKVDAPAGDPRAAPRGGLSRAAGRVGGLRANATQAPSASLPSPRAQGAAGKEFVEGHWLGLEVVTLLPELAKEYRLPRGETGVLVDEVTLEAAESGILAGDLVRSVEGAPTPNLKAFFLATQRVREQGQAKVGISCRGSRMTLVIEARNAKEMGSAQMEAAQPILPGSLSPHRSRGRPCTDCHIVMRTGGQLPTDAGDLPPNPPPIARNASAPHGDRGPCSTCHAVR